MATSALLRNGPDHIGVVLAEMLAWMAEHEYVSTNQLRGSVSYARSDSPAAFERANYVRSLHSWITPADLVPTAPSAAPGELATGASQ
jgi:dihydroorotate dehydrogenase (fumarate)